jgi:PAS domain S-box-containing protein
MTKPRASAIVGLAVLLASSVCAIALDPSLDISQYAHTAWTVRDGFAKGPIHSIAQTPDGYLWLGTEAGLLRFDGVRAVPWQPPAGEHLPSNIVKKLLVSRDGTLWIGAGKGLASWKGGKLSQYPEMGGWIVDALVEDDEGTVWAGGLGVPGHGRLCAIKGGRAQCSDPGEGVQSIYEDSKNALWVSTFKGLWRWKPESPQFFPTGTTMTSALAEDKDGGLLFGRSTGIQRFVKGKSEVYPVAMLARQSGVDSFLWDHNDSLWVGSFSGLVHLHRGRAELFTQVDGLSANLVHCVFEDREGNIWVATEGGLDRFRDFSVPTFSAKEGFPAGLSGPILAAKNGSLWVGTADRLINWRNSEVTVDDRTGPASNSVVNGMRAIHESGLRLQVQGLLQDSRGRLWVSTLGGFGYMNNDQFVLIKTVPGATKGSIAEGAGGDLWFSFDDALFHLVDGKNVERIPWDSLGVKEVGGRIAADPLQRGLWIGFSQGGIAYVGHGHIERLYTTADGLGEGRVSQFRADREGALWASTEGGLSRIKDGHVATLSTKNGLPCDAVHWSQEDADHSVWLYLECGLARVSASEMSAWITDPNRSVPVTLLDRSDGVATKSVLFGGFSAPVTESLDGKLWFSVEDGISVVDPRHLSFNKLAPPVYVEQIIADGKTYDVSNGLQLPARVRDVTVNYTALSFVEPEKVRFRFKLEGQDEDWREVANDRKVQYSNLPPGHHRFHVTASNNSGVWNEEGAVLDFAIAPAYYQTNWFRALCVTTFLALLWSAYEVRVRQLRGQENKLRNVIETIPTIVWTALPNGAVDFVNQHWEQATGLSTEKTLGSAWEAAIHPEDLKQHAEKWRASSVSGGPFENEARFRQAADGAYRWFLVRAVPLRDKRGRIVKWYGNATDIEDRKRTEEALRQSEAYLAEAQRLSHTGSFAYDPGTATTLYWSEEIFRIFGLDPQPRPPGFDETRRLVHPDDIDRVSQSCLKAFHDEAAFTQEYRILLHDKTVKHLHVMWRPVFDEDGELIQYIGAAADVTEHKRAEEALRRSEAYLAEGQRVSHTGSFGWNVKTGEIRWSEETFRIFQCDPSMKPTVELVLQRTHPEDVAFVKQEIERASQDWKDIGFEHRLLMPDGSVKHVRVAGRARTDKPGELEIVGAVTDITEAKRAEEALRRSEAYLAESQRLTKTGSWAHIPDGPSLFWSAETFRISGFAPEQGFPDPETVWRRIHPEDREKLRQIRQKAYEQKADYTSAFRYLMPDGTVKHLEGTGHPVLDAAGEVVEFMGTMTDVTDRKRAEEALRRSEAYLADAQRLTHTGTWAYKAGGVALYWSEENFRIWGFNPQHGVPDMETVQQRMHPEDRDREVEYAKRAVRAGKDFVQEFRIVLPDGNVRHIQSVGHPVFSASGEVTEVLGTHIDITERKHAEQERERLHQLEEDLAHMNRVVMLGELASSLAHEINQPITATVTSAKACLRWLAHDPPELERARAAAMRIESDGNRAGEIIHRLRMFYKTGAPPQRELVDINDVVDEMLVLLRNEAMRHSISLRTELAPQLPQVLADRVQLQQVLMNLMLNGIEAMADEAGELSVRSQRTENGLLLVSVSDTGVGLPSEKPDLIFNAFYTTKPQGTGMGLAISRSIIEAHGGRLWASANAPRGATFHFTLPVEVRK